MVIAQGEIVDRFQLKSVIVPVKIRTHFRMASMTSIGRRATCFPAMTALLTNSRIALSSVDE
jgi:hypothetical protein